MAALLTLMRDLTLSEWRRGRVDLGTGRREVGNGLEERKENKRWLLCKINEKKIKKKLNVAK